MRERLVLRLPAQHEVVVTYDRVRTAAIALANNATDGQAVTAYETAREQFLSASRTALDAPIPEKQS